jgi:small subunit ribosomal protein S8
VTMTDPIADMLTRLRNASVARNETVRMPSSKLKESLAAILLREGYIAGYKVVADERRPGRALEVTLKYAPDRTATISGLRRVSKPGLRVYSGAEKMPRVLGGLGVAVVSTSQGLMTDREARKRRVGGEVLCYVW